MMEWNFDKWLEDVFQVRARRPAGVLITYVLGTFDADPAEPNGLVTCRCEFHDEVRRPRDARDYGAFFFGEMWVETAAAATKLDELRRGLGTVQDGRRPQTRFETLSIADRHILPKKTISRWSEWVALFRENSRKGNQPRGLHDPLVRRSLPPFGRAIIGILDWVWAGVEAGNTYENQMLVIVPDTRARIMEVTWERTDLLARIQSNLRAEQVEVQCRLETVTGPCTLLSQNPTDELVKWEIPPTATKAEMYLVDESSGLIAGGDFTNTGGKTTTDPESLSPQALADIDIASGESDVVEFKPFFGDKARGHEIARAVIAFANSKGGRLYIGVDDNGAPQGQVELAKVMGKNREPKEWPQALVELLSGVIRNIVKPIPKVDTAWVTVGGEPVLVATIAPGTGRPYSTHDNYIFVRKGASCRPPEPQTELRQMFDDETKGWTKL